MEQRYAALLQMYGEKAEEADELRLDLQDVKSMYRQQVGVGVHIGVIHSHVTYLAIYRLSSC